MKLSHILTAIALSCGLSMAMPAIADTQADFDTAMSYYNNQNYTQAFPIFKRLAEQGDAYAQYNLGLMYVDGQGIRQSYAEAMTWWKKAHAQGHAEAAYNIAVMYYNGEGVRQNKSTAKEWYGKACDLGDQMGCDKYKQLHSQGY